MELNHWDSDCEREEGRGPTTTSIGILGDQVSSCRAKILVSTSSFAHGQKQTGSVVWPGNLACWGLPNLGPQTRSAGPGAWTTHTQTEELSCCPTNWGTRLPDPLNHSAWLGKFESYVNWVSQSCSGMSLSRSPPPPPTTEHGPQSYMRGRSGKNTWRLPNPGTLEPREGQAVLITPWEKPLAPYGQRTWGTERFESRLRRARLSLNQFLSLYQGRETNF